MSFLLIDILPLKKQVTLEEAVEYFDNLKPVFERHGLKRRDNPLEVVKLIRGELPAQLVNFFETRNPETSLKGMSEDPDYQANISRRDALFDLERATILLTARI